MSGGRGDSLRPINPPASVQSALCHSPIINRPATLNTPPRYGPFRAAVIFLPSPPPPRPLPCRYGPFWVATTLIFVTAASGNLSSYLAYRVGWHLV